MANPTWAPATADIAAFLPDRVQTEEGDFSELSTPTVDQVQPLIDSICADIQAEVGIVPAIPTGLADMAKRAAILGVSADIELGYMSEDADEKSGRAKQLADRYTAALARLRRAVIEVAETGSVGPTSDIPLPVFGFPDPADPNRAVDFTTWATRF